MRVSPIRILLLGSTVLCPGAHVGARPEPPGPGYSRIRIEAEDYGWVLKSAIWVFAPGAEKIVFVCWEDDARRFEMAREWVRKSVRDTWERHSALSFRGWGRCAPRNAGIRIRVADEGPHVKALGRKLDGVKDGMVLNFTFSRWFQDCRANPEPCVRTIAVHEFGHALGFAHEQNHFDAPGECRRRRQGTLGDHLLTPYDRHSVMNYCNEKYGNDGKLSPLDVASVEMLYCKKTDPACESSP